jgi:hypothetical protein
VSQTVPLLLLLSQQIQRVLGSASLVLLLPCVVLVAAASCATLLVSLHRCLQLPVHQ